MMRGPLPTLAPRAASIGGPITDREREGDRRRETESRLRKLNYANGHSNPASTNTTPSKQLQHSSGSDAEDPTAHGLDPALYGAGTTSSYSMGDHGTFHSSSSNMVSSTSCAGPTASSSWSSPAGGSGAATADGTSAGNRSSSLGGGGALAVSSSSTTAPSDQQQQRPRGLGLIQCTLQHFPVRKRLRVSVLKIEGLAGELRPELEIQPFCKVHIFPGKYSKQSGLVKRGRDVVFNQEFFFDGITTEELAEKSLSIEVCHQSAQKLGKDLEIGEVVVPLKDLTQLTLKKEVRILEELRPSVSNKKLGKISITTSIEKEARRLTINLLKVDDLPKWGIIGAPDVCVRITMSQGNSAPQTKSSRVLKNTTNAVYKEAVMFLVSTKPADLQRTKITIAVHDLSRTVTGDDVIGCVFLGELAIDRSEIDQWRNTVEHIGKEYKGTHNLKSSRNGPNAPDVHVSEAHSDEEDQKDG